jgi:hypothetical protein
LTIGTLERTISAELEAAMQSIFKLALGPILIVTTAFSQQTNLSGEWSGTFADSVANGSIKLNLAQEDSGHVSGTYSANTGGGGKIEGNVSGSTLSFSLTQTVEGCPGTYGGSLKFSGTAGSGSYSGNDCQGDRKNGTITISRVQTRADQEAPIGATPPLGLPVQENAPIQSARFFPQPGPPVEADYDDDGGDFKFLSSIALPADYGLDYTLGIQQAAQKGGRVTSGSLYEEGEQVFNQLLSSPKIAGLPYSWSFGLDTTQVVNAYATPSGVVAVNEPLAKMLAGDKGLWAAVLSHEVEHTARRHGVRSYLYEQNYERQLAYYQYRVLAGDKNANWSIVGLRIGYGIGVKKLAREQEHDADKQGMLLMARAGYHPDFVFALHKMMVSNLGDQGKFAAFFSGHPRWATRDERSQRAFDKALATYQQMWPDPAHSPGGVPPTVAFMGKPKSDEDKQGHVAKLQIPLYCRNAVEPVAVDVSFTDEEGKGAEALIANFRTPEGRFEVFENAECPSKLDGVLNIAIPSGAVPEKQRKLKAVATVFDNHHRLIEMSKPFDVKIPK